MSEISLNKYEKEKRVIEMYLAPKTIREIAQELHMSFTFISNIIKNMRQKELQAKREEYNQNGQIKKPSLSSQAYKLFRDGKKLIDVAIDLEIPARKAVKLWSQFLRFEKMYECYEFYEDYRHDLPTLLSINNFMKRNKVDGKNITNVLRTANNVRGKFLYNIHYIVTIYNNLISGLVV